jgi:hypothetical protein
MYDNTPKAAPVRRRIIQQPLRTEASFALIASEASPVGELAARLKRTRPLIMFPSLSHFLAEPPRRERWAAILVARSGAWDPRLDAYVRSRRRIALFSLPEESYGWPEAVARVRDMGELEPWLEAIDAPEPPAKKERVKRSSRAQATATLAQQNARPSQSAAPAPAASESLPQAPDVAQGEAAPATPRQPLPRQIELDLPRAERKPRKTRKSPPRPERAVEPPSPRPADLVRSILAEARARRATADDEGNREFERLAAELGLVRAFELLDELRERAVRLVSAVGRP